MALNIEPGVTIGSGVLISPANIITPKIPHTVTANGNAQVSTAQVKFGTGSYTSNVLNGMMVVTPFADLAFGTGDFTIEMWYYPTTLTGDCTLYGMRPPSSQGAYPVISTLSGDFVNYYTAIGYKISSPTALVVNTWSSIALCRYQGNTKLYINGTQSGATYADTNVYLAGSCGIGGNDFFPGRYPVNGFLDEVRISNVARYTGNYTPATAPFTTDTNTLVLIHCDGTNASTVFTDSSNTL